MQPEQPDFKSLFESMPGRYLVLDSDLTIVAASDAYLKMTMTTRSEIVGRPLFDVFPENPDEMKGGGESSLRASFDRVRRELVSDTMPVFQYDIRRPELEGGGFEVRYWSPVNSPVLGPDGRLLYILNRVEDVTDFMRLREQSVVQDELTANLEQRMTRMELELFERAQELQKLNIELQAANKAKSVFLANMSHELRTPLNAILGFSDLLINDRNGHFSAEVRSGFLAHIRAGGEHLLSLINDILDLSKVEAGQMQLRLETVAVAGVVDDVASTTGPLLAKKQLALDVDARSAGNLVADAAKLRQMLLNLISNAIKFTPEGGTVTIRTRRLTETLEISIADTGIGISEADRGRLFEEFLQLDSGPGRQEQGTGLGLALTQRFAVLHGGFVRVESEIGRGSVFTLCLPLAGPVSNLAVAAKPASMAAAAARNDVPLILVVEDNPASAALMTHIIERGGYRAEIARSGPEALAKARELNPVAITLDIVLPELDGWDVLTRLKRDEATSGIPVVVVSVVDNPELGNALGALDYVTKPVRADELLKRLNRFQLKHTPGREKFRVLVVDDESANRDFLAEVLGEAGYQVILAPGGDEAIRFAKSEQPDLVLLDLMMPEVTGFDVVEALRADAATAKIPIIVLTAKHLTEADKRHLNGHVSAIFSRASTGATDLLQQLQRVVGSRP